MSDTRVRMDFVKRLNQACDGSSLVPDLNHGRYVVLAEHLGVSVEAVRKWFAGIAMPGRGKMRDLAAFLKVDELWLAHGRKPDMDREDTARFAREIAGAVLVVAGMASLAGGQTAWPGDADPRKGLVDFYTIIKGRQYSIHVCLGRETSAGRFEVEAPQASTDLTLIGVIPSARKGLYDFLQLPWPWVSEAKNRRTGGYTLVVERSTAGHKTGHHIWPQVRSFSDLQL